jgi:hypothetical protein
VRVHARRHLLADARRKRLVREHVCVCVCVCVRCAKHLEEAAIGVGRQLVGTHDVVVVVPKLPDAVEHEHLIGINHKVAYAYESIEGLAADLLDRIEAAGRFEVVRRDVIQMAVLVCRALDEEEAAERTPWFEAGEKKEAGSEQQE